LISCVLIVDPEGKDQVVLAARAALAAVDDVMELDPLARAADPAVRDGPLASPLVALPDRALDRTRNRRTRRRARGRLLGRARPLGQAFALLVVADDAPQALLEDLQLGGARHLVRERRAGAGQEVLELAVGGQMPPRELFGQHLDLDRAFRNLSWSKYGFLADNVFRHRLGGQPGLDALDLALGLVHRFGQHRVAVGLGHDRRQSGQGRDAQSTGTQRFHRLREAPDKPSSADSIVRHGLGLAEGATHVVPEGAVAELEIGPVAIEVSQREHELDQHLPLPAQELLEPGGPLEGRGLGHGPSLSCDFGPP